MMVTGDLGGSMMATESAVRDDSQSQIQVYIDRLEMQVVKLTNANAALSGCLDRAIGPTPSPVDATDRGAPQGMLSRLDQLLEQLDGQTEIAMSHARRMSEIL